MISSRIVTSTRRSPRRIAFIATVALLAAMVITVPASADVSFINSRRASAGLAPVVDHGGLASLAASHAREMAQRGSLFHSTNLGSKVSTVLSGWQAVGENVGVGGSLAEVNSMFMQSSSHRANIVGNFSHAGVGAVTGPDGRVWVTQVFARVPTVTAAAVPAPRPTAPRVSRSVRRDPLPEPEPVRIPLATSGFAPREGGYAIVTDDGGVFAFDGAPFAGSASGYSNNGPVVDAAATPTSEGYVLFAGDGGVFAFGDAGYAGSAAGGHLNGSVVAGHLTATGDGYRLIATDGGVLTFGDAAFLGSVAGQQLNAPIVAAASTATGDGYILVGADGGVFAFGDAAFAGGLANQSLNAPIVDVAITRTGLGYWLAAADGGVFAFGDAVYAGGVAEGSPDREVVAIVPAPMARGYWLVTEDKQVTAFGQVEFPPEATLAPPTSLIAHRA